MSLLGRLHGRLVHEGRVSRLSALLADLLPTDASVLDVGCGDGRIASLIETRRPDIKIRGIDLIVRKETLIPVSEFDGKQIPFEDDSFDVVMFVDVLHHTDDPMILLREAARVSKSTILLKDHNNDGLFSDLTLRVMDLVGNRPHGVPLPYNYWRKRTWTEAFESLGLEPREMITELGLYPSPINVVCGRQLHFITSLSVPLN